MLLLLLACPPTADSDSSGSTGTPVVETEPQDSEEEPPIWTGEAQARVLDPEGNPVEGAFVLLGGWTSERWVSTDAEGLATVAVDDEGTNPRYLVAAKQDWLSAGVRVPDEQPDTLEITLRPLPNQDNLDYSFQSGGVGGSESTDQCGHCHITIADDWSVSVHAEAAKDPEVWDLYTGRGSRLASCDEGELAEGQLPGQSGVAEYCYVTTGVLPWLNEGCGGHGEPRCDHPDQRADLEHLGGCGDCHSPAVDGGTPGHIDFAGAQGVAYEGVTCDLCHKVRRVEPGPAAGLNGALVLERPSEPSLVGTQEFDPIMFGPYADVIVPIMNGSYAPQFRESEWCSACHEYGQPALHPDQELDDERWPDGLPVHETWTEFLASGAQEAGFSCQGCHMPTLYEDSSTYNTPEGDSSGPVHGWVREEGQVHHHTWPDAQDLGEPGLDLELSPRQGWQEARVTLTNRAPHALPTGEPLRQVIVLVSAVDEQGEAVAAVGGQTVPDVGGYTLTGVLGEQATLEHQLLKLPGSDDLSGSFTLRFVRPTGTWDDYAGPGTRTADGLSPEQKGLPLHDFVVEVDATASEGGLLLAEAVEVQEGDRVYVVRERQYAGAPGWLYAKVLVDHEGDRAVPHYRAIDVASDNRIAGLGSSTSTHRFPEGELTITATVVRRDHATAVSEPYGWPSGDRMGGQISVQSGDQP